MTNLSVSDAVSIVDPSKPEYQFAQEAARTYLKELHSAKRTEHSEPDCLVDRGNAPLPKIFSADKDASIALQELKSGTIIESTNFLTGLRAPVRDHDFPGVFTSWGVG